MKISGQVRVRAPRAAVYAALRDARFFASCVEGVHDLTEIAADRYVSDETWKQLAGYLDRKQLMDLVFTIGAYDLLAMAFKNFGLELDSGMTGFPSEA